MELWNLFSIGAGGVAIGVAAMMWVFLRRPSVKDLGSVSSQWVIEHRTSQAEGTVH